MRPSFRATEDAKNADERATPLLVGASGAPRAPPLSPSARVASVRRAEYVDYWLFIAESVSTVGCGDTAASYQLQKSKRCPRPY